MFIYYIIYIGKRRRRRQRRNEEGIEEWIGSRCHRTCTIFIYFIQYLYIFIYLYICTLYIFLSLCLYIFTFIQTLHLYIFIPLIYTPHISMSYTPTSLSILYTSLYIRLSPHLYILYYSYITHTSLCITSAEGDLSLRDKHLSVVFSLRSKPIKQFNVNFHNYPTFRFRQAKILHSYIYNTCRVFHKPTPEHTVLKRKLDHFFTFIYYNTCKNLHQLTP